jgi:hypothetical protein
VIRESQNSLKNQHYLDRNLALNFVVNITGHAKFFSDAKQRALRKTNETETETERET